MTNRPDPRELRELDAALGLGGPGRYWGRLAAVGIAVASLFCHLYACTTPAGPITRAYGVVTALGFSEGETGSKPRASVRLGDRQVRVRLHAGSLCRVGDRILVTRHKMLVGYRHLAGSRGCLRAGSGAP